MGKEDMIATSIKVNSCAIDSNELSLTKFPIQLAIADDRIEVPS